MSDSLKVTDKRIFTPDGQLKEEFQFLDEQAPSPSAQPVAAEPAPEPAAPPAAPERDAHRGPAPSLIEPPPSDLFPGGAGAGPGIDSGLGPDSPTFFDLVAMLAEPASIYLGDVQLPGGQSAEDLEMARVHIDLLAVLWEKTAGNLSSQEAAILEDLLYRLRMRYVQKRG